MQRTKPFIQEKVTQVPTVAYPDIPVVRKAQTTREVPQIQHDATFVDVPVITTHYVDKFVDVLVPKIGEVPQVQKVTTTVGVPQVQYQTVSLVTNHCIMTGSRM